MRCAVWGLHNPTAVGTRLASYWAISYSSGPPQHDIRASAARAATNRGGIQMGRLGLVLAVLVLCSSTSVLAATKTSETSSPRSSEMTTRTNEQTGDMHANNGRFQLFVAPGHSGSPFLLDTTTGCIWHQVQNDTTKRTTFVEVDVENLHWSWGSGAQQILASRVDGSNLTDEQKRL